MLSILNRLTLCRALLVISVFNVLLFSVTIISGRLGWVQMTLTVQQRTQVILIPPTTNITAPGVVTTPLLLQTSPLLCMFTSFNTERRKAIVNNNTLHNWAALKTNVTGGPPRVQPILYIGPSKSPISDRVELMKSARRLGWTVLRVPRVSSVGLPHFKEMYFKAAKIEPNCTFCGFANGDILFNKGMVDTLEAVAEELHTLNRTMVIGRRYNVAWRNLTLYRPEHVEQIAKKYGRLHMLAAEDYFFIAKNDFPWKSLPDVVIARRGYDNFLVMMAVRQRVSVVDATETMVAVHQSDSQSKDPHRHSKEHEINMVRMGNFNSAKGLTTNSQYLTKTVWNQSRKKRTIVVQKRPRTVRRPVIRYGIRTASRSSNSTNKSGGRLQANFTFTSRLSANNRTSTRRNLTPLSNIFFSHGHSAGVFARPPSDFLHSKTSFPQKFGPGSNW